MQLTDVINRCQTMLKDHPIDDCLIPILSSVADVFCDRLGLERDEVAIFFLDKHKTNLSFVFPPYLIDQKTIAVEADEAIVAQIFRSGEPFINNRLLEKDHMSEFEFIKTPSDETKLIWKMMGALIQFKDEKIGVIEVSKRRAAFSEVGRDFTSEDMVFLQETSAQLAPLFKDLRQALFLAKREQAKKDLALLAEIIRWRRGIKDGDCAKVRTTYLNEPYMCKGNVAHYYDPERIEIHTSTEHCQQVMTVALEALWPCSWDSSKIDRAVTMSKKLNQISRFISDG